MLLKKRINIILIIAFFLLTPHLASARPGYASKENVGCSYCHSNDGRSQLNHVGIYYRNNGYSLQDYNTSAQENTPAEPTVTGTSEKYNGKSNYTGDKVDDDDNYIDGNDKIDEDDKLDEIAKSGNKKQETQQSEGKLKTLPSDFSVVFSLAGIIAIMLSKKQI